MKLPQSRAIHKPLQLDLLDRLQSQPALPWYAERIRQRWGLTRGTALVTAELAYTAGGEQ